MLEVILDKVGIAVRTQLEAVGDLAVGPNGRVRDDGGAECCLRDADGERGGEDGSGLVTSRLIGNVQGHAATELDSTGDRWNLMIRHHASKPEVANRRGLNA